MKLTGTRIGFVVGLSLAFVTAGCAPSSSSDATKVTTPATTTLTVTAPNAPSAYTINGSDNPTLTMQKGQTYTINLSVSGHPFYIMSSLGTNTANAYNTGVTGNGTQVGTLTFVVPTNAPATLYYDCSIHSGMAGVINITN